MKRKQIIIISIVGILFLLLCIGVVLEIKNTATEEVDRTVSLIETQIKQEKEFKVEGATIDEPNIYLNPYGI